jgi:hypothetical protein
MFHPRCVFPAAEALAGFDLVSPSVEVGAILALGWPSRSL